MGEQIVVTMEETRAALERLFDLAYSDTGQARTVADFLMACWNAQNLGGFNPVSLANVDRAISRDMATFILFLSQQNCAVYFDAFGMEEQIQRLIHMWRKTS